MVGGFFLVMLASVWPFWRWLFEERFFPRVNSDFVVGNVEMPQGGAFSDTQAMRDRMIQAAEEIKDSYNAQPRFAETGAIDNILGVAGGNKIDLVMQTVNDDLIRRRLQSGCANVWATSPKQKMFV